jgi:chromosome segregation ATPase
MNRFKRLITMFAFSLLVLGLPTLASAQWRDRDRNDDYRTDRRNRDDDDDYYRNNRRYDRNLQATIRNLKNRSKEFARRLDRELDRSRYDDRNREDQLNRLARSFKDAADDLDDAYDNRRDLRRSEDEARRVIQIGQQIDNALYRLRLSYNVQGDWNRIRQDLNALGNAYGYNYNNRNRNRNDRNGDWRNRLPWPF